MIKTSKGKKVKQVCDVSQNKLHKTNLKNIGPKQMARTIHWFLFFDSSLKTGNHPTFLIPTGTSSQILGARCDSVSEPKVTNFIALE